MGGEKCAEPESAGTGQHRRLGRVCLLHLLRRQAENVSFESRRASKCVGCSLPAVRSVMVTFIMNRGGGGGTASGGVEVAICSPTPTQLRQRLNCRPMSHACSQMHKETE